MNLPELGSLSPLGWVILTAIVVLCSVAVYVVEDEKKKGRKIPGHMCSGCQDNGMILPEETDREDGAQ